MYAYWGKATQGSDSAHLLVYHCLDVSATLRAFFEYDVGIAKNIHALAHMPAEHVNGLLYFFACLHDLGKFAPAFQTMRRDIMARLGAPREELFENFHHTAIGCFLFDTFLMPEWRGDPASPFRDADPGVIAPLSHAAFWHHGRPGSRPGHVHLPQSVYRDARALAEEAARLFLPPGLALPDDLDAEDFFKPVSWLFAGLIVLCDWIASGPGFAHRDAAMPLATYFHELSLPQAREAVRRSGILCPPPRSGVGFHELLPSLGKMAAPTPLQELALAEAGRDVGQRLLIFEDVTGAGKTEAALLAAHGLMAQGQAEGLYVGLPTMATANAMYARLSEGYDALFETAEDRPSLLLAHAKRSLSDRFLASIELERGRPGQGDAEGDGQRRDSGAFCAEWLADNRKKALLAPCGVGTLDQALLAILPARHQCLRLLGLARGVLVVDEAHAYDAYTTRLLATLLTFQAGLGGSAILLSATLPLRTRRELAAAFCRGAGFDPPVPTNAPLPQVTRIDVGGVEEIALVATRRIEVAVELTADPEAAIERLAAVRAAGGCGLYILNTVDRAVAAHAALSARPPAGEAILFHARFALGDRLAIEERVLAIFGKGAPPKARRGKILVATQVVEQSLDIDADMVVSELAPAELVIQRLGRCQRHERDWRPAGFAAPSLLVIAPEARDDAGPDWGSRELGHGLYVYPVRAVLWRTARLLARLGRVALPDQARLLVEGAYDDAACPAPAVLSTLDQKEEGRRFAGISHAIRNGLGFDQGYGPDAASDAWRDEAYAPTRLCEETTTLRLVRADGGGLRLWAGEETNAHACALSEVTVLSRRVAGVVADRDWEERLADFAATMPDRGRWVRLIPLVRDDAAADWVCPFGGDATLRYSSAAGLRIEGPLGG